MTTYGEWITEKNEGHLWPIYEADKHDLAFEYSLLMEYSDAIKDMTLDMNRLLFGQPPLIDFGAGGECSTFTIPIKKRRALPAPYGPYYSAADQLTLFELPWWATGAPVPTKDDWYDD